MKLVPFEVTPLQFKFDRNKPSSTVFTVKNKSDVHLIHVLPVASPHFTVSSNDTRLIDPEEIVDIRVGFAPINSSDTLPKLAFDLESRTGDTRSVNIDMIDITEEVQNTKSEKSNGCECPICTEGFDETDHTPRILSSCGHTVCEKCCKELLRQGNGTEIKCPTEQTITKVNGDVKLLPKNFAVLEILEAQRKEMSKKGDNEALSFGKCGEDPSHVAKFYCQICAADLCEECFTKVHSLKILSTHRKIPIAEKPFQLPKCKKHPYNTAEFVCAESYCEIKDNLMCHTCLLGNHRNHRHKEFMEVVELNRNKLKQMLIENREYVERLKEMVLQSQLESRGQNELCEQKKKEIADHYDRMKNEAIELFEAEKSNYFHATTRTAETWKEWIDIFTKAQEDISQKLGARSGIVDIKDLEKKMEKFESEGWLTWNSNTNFMDNVQISLPTEQIKIHIPVPGESAEASRPPSPTQWCLSGLRTTV